MGKYLFVFAIISCVLMSFAFASGGPCGWSCDSCYNNGFNGVYVGGNLGIITHKTTNIDQDHFTANSAVVFNTTNVTAGVQAGYNWLFCNKLLGIVVDWNWAEARKRLRIEPNNPSTNQSVASGMHWFTTIRARAGWTACDALFYVTLGAVVSRLDGKWTNGADEIKDSDTRWGWAGGFGTEYLLGCNWSLGAEILTLQLSGVSKARVPVPTIVGPSVAITRGNTAWVGRILLNYRFGNLCSFCCR